jgi:hypothetical protein
VYAHERADLKRDTALLDRVFDRVVDEQTGRAFRVFDTELRRSPSDLRLTKGTDFIRC